jgi:hypothetical protein
MERPSDEMSAMVEYIIPALSLSAIALESNNRGTHGDSSPRLLVHPVLEAFPGITPIDSFGIV